jgi:transposase
MRRVIGLDVHRTFAEVVFWEDGRLRPAGRVDMTRSGLEGFGRTLARTDEVVVEATGNAMAVVRVLSPYVARVIMANPLQVRAIAHARIKTDKIDAGVLAQLRAADFLPEVWLPDAETERRRRLVTRRNQVVRHRTRVKNEVHAILHAHLIPPCPHADLFGGLGRAWLGKQTLPEDEVAAIGPSRFQWTPLLSSRGARCPDGQQDAAELHRRVQGGDGGTAGEQRPAVVPGGPGTRH